MIRTEHRPATGDLPAHWLVYAADRPIGRILGQDGAYRAEGGRRVFPTLDAAVLATAQQHLAAEEAHVRQLRGWLASVCSATEGHKTPSLAPGDIVEYRRQGGGRFVCELVEVNPGVRRPYRLCLLGLMRQGDRIVLLAPEKRRQINAGAGRIARKLPLRPEDFPGAHRPALAAD